MWKLTTACDQGLAAELSAEITSGCQRTLNSARSQVPGRQGSSLYKQSSISLSTFDTEHWSPHQGCNKGNQHEYFVQKPVFRHIGSVADIRCICAGRSDTASCAHQRVGSVRCHSDSFHSTTAPRGTPTGTPGGTSTGTPGGTSGGAPGGTSGGAPTGSFRKTQWTLLLQWLFGPSAPAIWLSAI